ncbi:MAG: hypothetical protein WBE43_05005 [Candidatus Acidiferrales bacterium]
MAVSTTKFPMRGARSRSTTARGASPNHAQQPSDDEILGLVTAVSKPIGTPTSENISADFDDASDAAVATAPENNNDSAADPSSSAASPVLSPAAVKALEAHPELRQAFSDAQAYHVVFATPEAARDAKNQLDDLDGMFFSTQPGDQAALAARIHQLSPEAFHRLAHAMHAHSAKLASAGANQPSASNSTATSAAGQTSAPAQANATVSAPSASNPAAGASDPAANAPAVSHAQAAATTSPVHDAAAAQSPQPAPSQISLSVAPTVVATPAAPATPAQPFVDPQRAAKIAFFHSTNAAAVQQIIGAIQSQVDNLLPQNVPSGTRTRIVGEIYRDLDATLRANRQLGKQLRDAFQGGPGDAAHQRAIVTLVTGRAKQALPAVAKRVIGEWTQSIVGANRERLARHESASKRVDIAGASPSDGVNRKPLSPRDVDYKRLSDADILNL